MRPVSLRILSALALTLVVLSFSSSLLRSASASGPQGGQSARTPYGSPQFPGLPTPPLPIRPGLAPLPVSPGTHPPALGNFEQVGKTRPLTQGGSPIFFQAPSYSSGGSYAFFVAAADFNGDGKTDFALANQSNDTVGILLGNGDGTFQPPQTYPAAGAGTRAVAVADVNGDGNTDVVVANECQVQGCNEDGTVGILLGNGDGTFQPVQVYDTGGRYALSVAVGDLNGDGKSDLVLTNECTDAMCSGSSVGVLLGNGDGTFQAAQNYASGGAGAFAVTIGEINGDGKADLVVANVSGSSVEVLLGNGDGTFQTAQSYASGGSTPTSVSVADVNGDGKGDVIAVNECDLQSCAAGTVGVLLGNGDGTFQTAQNYATGGQYAFSLALGDLNGDGRADLVVANQGSSSVGVLLGNGDGSFQPAETYASPGIATYGVTIADADGDGRADVVTANGCFDTYCKSGGGIGVLLGNSDGTLKSNRGFATGGPNALAVSVGDVNGDGKTDLLIANQCLDASCYSGGLDVLLANGDGTFQPAQQFGSGGQFALSVASGDLNGDGKIDVVVANQDANNGVGVLLGNGDGTFQTAQIYSSGGLYPAFITVADLNGDGYPDIAVVNTWSDSTYTSGAVDILLGNGNGTFQPPQSYLSAGYGGTSAAVKDLNGDGKPDLIVTNQCVDSNCATGSVAVLLGNGDGTFQAAQIFVSAGRYAFSVAAGDLNGDGKADLAVADTYGLGSNFVDGVISVLLGNGDGTFQAAQGYDSGAANARIAAIADVNGDGKADVIAGNAGGVSVLIGNGDGTLQSATVYAVSGLSVALADFNGDGKADVAAIDGSFGSVLLNISVAPLTTATTLTSSLNPSSLGQSITFTVTVTATSGTPTGSVSFYDGTSLLGAGTLSSGTASYSTSSLALGSHSITAVYGGDSNFGGSTSSVLTQVVNTAVTSTLLSSNLNPSTYGQSVTLSASVTASTGIPTGSVTFYDGTASLGTMTLDGNGGASLSVSSLSVGSHSLTAAYSGDSNNSASTSSSVNQEVDQASSSTVLISGQNPSAYGQVVNLIAVVSPGSVVTGTVTFYDGPDVLFYGAPLSANRASVFINVPNAGTHSITAQYSGDGNYTGSTSTIVSQQVNQATSSTTISSSANPVVVKSPVTFTATVTGQYGRGSGGTVTFMNGAKVLGTSPVVNSAASLTITFVTAGSRSVNAVYSGDANLSGSTSSTLTQQVSKATSTVTLTSSRNPSNVGQAVTFTATVSSSLTVPNGETVNFLDGATVIATKTTASGVATFTTSSLAHGNHQIKAQYVGDSNIKPGVSPIVKQKVN